MVSRRQGCIKNLNFITKTKYIQKVKNRGAKESLEEGLQPREKRFALNKSAKHDSGVGWHQP